MPVFNFSNVYWRVKWPSRIDYVINMLYYIMLY